MTTTTATARIPERTRILTLPVLPWALWRALLVAGAALLAAALVAMFLLALVGVADVPGGPGPVPIPRPAGF